ncbi:acyltransferase [Microvirga sp. STR05]|uniref:Acyltransferase n=1 Tax=Hymenobacter duratus TaxID=2771356 RepID=A0ABR8JK21_9BACT|nr:acyltransferase [Hymenobacter duratus]MBD2715727.1 acyltransferase [Hymenobacter duratus]MBR7950638.1 acyltransferase [Microvirga sp. STR05]
MAATSEVGSAQYDKTLLKNCGDDVFISANVEIRRPALVSVGSHVAIDTGFYLTTAASIGDYIHIAPYSTIIGGAQGLVSMAHFSSMAAGCRVICGSDAHMGHGLVGPTVPEEYHDIITFAPVTFEKFASIGTNVVVMPGVTLGEGSVVGACSLVTKDTEPWTVYVGVPARPVKVRPRENMIEYAKKLGY